MISEAKTVAVYLREVPEDRRAVLRRRRALCRELLPEHEEAMEYGCPCYRRNGKVEVGFASQKRTINLYIVNQDALAKHRARLKGLSVGKGCIRYPSPARMDFGVIADLLRATSESDAGPCGPRLAKAAR